MRINRVLKVLGPTLLLLAAASGKIYAKDARPQASPVSASEPASHPPCEGLLCMLTPNSMARPITAAEAIEMTKAAEARAAQLQLTASAKHKRSRSASGRSRLVAAVARRNPGSDTARAGPRFVQLVASKDVASIEQLAGKQVSFGPPGSAGQAIGRKIFASLRVGVQETPLDLDNALDGAVTGDVAAIVVVDRNEIARLRDQSSSNLHLLSVPTGVRAPDGMSVATLPSTADSGLARGKLIRTFVLDASLPIQSVRRLASRN